MYRVELGQRTDCAGLVDIVIVLCKSCWVKFVVIADKTSGGVGLVWQG